MARGHRKFKMNDLPLKLRLFEDFLPALLRCKPDFFFGMSRLQDDILPVILVQHGVSFEWCELEEKTKGQALPW